jgi:C4-dicarboxylate transporter, DctQ subunit
MRLVRLDRSPVRKNTVEKLATIRARFEQLLELIVVLLVLGLTCVVVIGFGSRLLDRPLSWTGEIASNGLAWLTYYGGVLAAARGAHMTCPNIVNMLPPALRVPVVFLAEVLTIGFFVLLAWTGVKVFLVLQDSTLVSLPWISQQFTQSAIPITSVLFIIAELMRFPQILAAARGSGFGSDHELDAVLPHVAGDVANQPDATVTAGGR